MGRRLAFVVERSDCSRRASGASAAATCLWPSSIVGRVMTRQRSTRTSSHSIDRPDSESRSRDGEESRSWENECPEQAVERERRRRAAAALRARLEAGNYQEILGQRILDLLRDIAAEVGVSDELAILRLVMARLLAEEDDPVTLANTVARVASVSIRAAQVQRAITGQLADTLTESLTSLLTNTAALDLGGSES